MIDTHNTVGMIYNERVFVVVEKDTERERKGICV